MAKSITKTVNGEKLTGLPRGGVWSTEDGYGILFDEDYGFGRGSTWRVEFPKGELRFTGAATRGPDGTMVREASDFTLATSLQDAVKTVQRLRKPEAVATVEDRDRYMDAVMRRSAA